MKKQFEFLLLEAPLVLALKAYCGMEWCVAVQ